MIRTVVCHKEGCSGNRFYIETVENKIKAICRECNSEYLYDAGNTGYELVSSCTSCRNDSFKLFKDMNTSKIYAKCTECGNPPERIFVDPDGIQIPYETKLLQEIKDEIVGVNQRLCNLDIKLENVERGQSILEESLAYVNKYIVEER
ncbi:hypothetical protein [Clostridium sp.]|uniref:hypothetical protein n=1 Tax=Clostridium sp. TaxID=1506 RepID=UPI002FC834CC